MTAGRVETFFTSSKGGDYADAAGRSRPSEGARPCHPHLNIVETLARPLVRATLAVPLPYWLTRCGPPGLVDGAETSAVYRLSNEAPDPCAVGGRTR